MRASWQPVVEGEAALVEPPALAAPERMPRQLNAGRLPDEALRAAVALLEVVLAHRAARWPQGHGGAPDEADGPPLAVEELGVGDAAADPADEPAWGGERHLAKVRLVLGVGVHVVLHEPLAQG